MINVSLIVKISYCKLVSYCKLLSKVVYYKLDFSIG